MYGFVYVTTNLVNGKRYIGQRKCRAGDGRYLGSGTLLRSAIKKYGRDSFHRHVLQWCSSKEELDAAEAAWITQEGATSSDSYYNVANGGSSPMAGVKHRAESRKKISDAHTGKVRSDEHRSNLSKAKKGQTSAAIKAAAVASGLARRGRGFTDDHRRSLSEASTAKRPVRCIETGEIFESMKVAAVAVDAPCSCVRQAAMTGWKCRGFTYEFVEDQS